eukprot:sb/3476402/
MLQVWRGGANEWIVAHSKFLRKVRFKRLDLRFLEIGVQSDPDLPGCSGERVLPGKSGYPVYRGQKLLIFYFGGSLLYILPVNRGSGISGPGKSGSTVLLVVFTKRDPEFPGISGQVV